MSLKSVLKSGTASRDEIARAINKRAEKIAKRHGHSEVTRSDYEKALEEGYAGHEQASKSEPTLKREPRMARVTKAEATLDRKAKKLMKAKPGMSYAQACAKMLEQIPSLYDEYQQEIQQVAVFEVPEVSELCTGKLSDLGRLRDSVDADVNE